MQRPWRAPDEDSLEPLPVVSDPSPAPLFDPVAPPVDDPWAASALPHAPGQPSWWAPVAARPDIPLLEDVPAPEAGGPPRSSDPFAGPADEVDDGPLASASPALAWSKRTIALALVLVALGGGIAGSIITRATRGADDQTGASRDRQPSRILPPANALPSTRAPSGSQPKVFNGIGNTVADVVAAVAPGVVAVQVVYPDGSSGSGTGMILTAEGEVVTNAHVVEGASGIRVLLAGERQPRTASLVGADDVVDLALLRIDGASGLPTVTMGRSASVAVGDDVVAIGNALALAGGPTVTRGIISAIDRTLETAQGAMSGLLQTDASISSGNSGGPLVDVDGEVIGINTAVAASRGGVSAENIGFAIASDRALPVIERLRAATGPAAGAKLGVNATNTSDGAPGAVVVSVDPGSAADLGGLRAGDLIIGIDRNPITDASGLAAAMADRTPGQRITVVLVRDGRGMSLPVTLSAAD